MTYSPCVSCATEAQLNTNGAAGRAVYCLEYMSNGLRALFDIDYLRSSYFLQQFAPILVLVLGPCIILLGVSAVKAQLPALSWLASMVLQTLGLTFPWNWIQDHASGSTSPERRKGRKKRVRTRAEQMEVHQNGSAIHGGQSTAPCRISLSLIRSYLP